MGRTLAAVAVGGATGTLARAALVHGEALGGLSWRVLAANLVGAFVLGWVAVRIPEATPLRALLGAGLCGGLTTFSTLQVETLLLIEDGRTGVAAAGIAISLAGGLAAVLAGARLARRARVAR